MVAAGRPRRATRPSTGRAGLEGRRGHHVPRRRPAEGALPSWCPSRRRQEPAAPRRAGRRRATGRRGRPVAGVWGRPNCWREPPQGPYSWVTMADPRATSSASRERSRPPGVAKPPITQRPKLAPRPGSVGGQVPFQLPVGHRTLCGGPETLAVRAPVAIPGVLHELQGGQHTGLHSRGPRCCGSRGFGRCHGSPPLRGRAPRHPVSAWCPAIGSSNPVSHQMMPKCHLGHMVRVTCEPEWSESTSGPVDLGRWRRVSCARPGFPGGRTV